MSRFAFSSLRYLGIACFLATASAGSAAITYPVTFSDPGGTYSVYYTQITNSIQAAGARWAQVLAGSGSLEVQVEFTQSIATLDGASFSNGFVHTNGARNVYEQGAAYEIRTGTDPNGATPDIHIRINPVYLANEMWFDPNPSVRTAAIPANHQDALSLFIHELGHAFVFSGFMNGTTGALPATYESTFDEQMLFDGTNFYFEGAKAKAVYGGPVPITYGNYAHLGNSSPRPGSNLLGDLMNGVSYTFQTRYDISPVDLAIAKDAGLILLTPSRLLNISTRMEVLTANNVLIGGFIVTGTEPKKVIIRGLGPSLSLAGVLANPLLELHDSAGAIIDSNDNWQTNSQGQSQEAEVNATGIPPTNSLEAVIIATLPANNAKYTAVLKGVNNGTGIGLVEIYDLAQGTNSQLANISTRGFVDTGNNVMIGGLIAGPNANGSSRVIIRAIGPSLPVANALPDPTLELHDANGAILVTNDNWKAADVSGQSQEAAITATSVPPTNDKESALLVNLVPGNYTAVVRSKTSATGVALVEAYNLQ